MKTYNRNPLTVDTDLDNYTKYFNQMAFKGINEDDNIYALDQTSSRDAENVYVDDMQRLVSRPSIQKATLPTSVVWSNTSGTVTTGEVVPSLYRLIDIKDFGSGKVYVSASTQNDPITYTIIVVPTEDITLDKNTTFVIQSTSSADLTNYHLCTIEQYVICFNNIDAKILDTNNLEAGWQKFTDFAEIPVVKTVTGTSVSNSDLNQFIPNLYKENYIYSSESQPLLPEGTGTLTLTNNLGEFALGSKSELEYAEYSLLRPLPINPATDDFIVSAAKSVVCIAYSQYFMYSANYGESFTRVYYPLYNGTYQHIAEVSKDGLYFFFVTSYGVYRCDLSDLTWSTVFRRNNSGEAADLLGTTTSFNNSESHHSYFLNGTTFMFYLRDTSTSTLYLYFKGPGLYIGTDYTQDHMDATADDFYLLDYITSVRVPSETSLYTLMGTTTYGGNYGSSNCQLSMKIITDEDNREATIATWVIKKPAGAELVYLFGGDTSNLYDASLYMLSGYVTLRGYRGYVIQNMGITELALSDYTTINIAGVIYSGLHYYTDKCQINIAISEVNSTATITLSYSNYSQLNDYYITSFRELPAMMGNVALYDTTSNITFSVESEDILYTSVETVDMVLAVTDDIYYAWDDSVNSQYRIETDYTLWTNYLGDNDVYTIEYTMGSAGTYTEVPNVSYSDTELYLGFDNLLQITYNNKDTDEVTKTLFNLPVINNQLFIDNITGLVNISTTEVAIFFKNKIVVCSKEEDSTLTQGFRYDYNNTKLSTGIRLDDTVMNTLEGSYTIFPTLRGLAALSYQAFMSTTDQTISYITDVIKDTWTKFYQASSIIKIIQWRTRLIITNDTTTILIYDMVNEAWWKWSIPEKALITLTDQIDLQLIENSGTVNDTLKYFKDKAEFYYDNSESGEFNHPIDWYIISQPLHFSAPNYYKNIRQLIFQLSDSDETDGKVEKTMDAQVKLFRKKVTVRDPESVAFKITELRTFVKRFNYWKINELQWSLSNDSDTVTPYRLELNGVSIKYELGEEVR